MKLFTALCSVLLLLAHCSHPKLTARQNFDQIKEGMSLREAMDIFGLKDTVGKSHIQRYEVVEIDTTEEIPIPLGTGDTLEVLCVDFDSTYTFILSGDSIVQKIDNTFLNSIVD